MGSADGLTAEGLIADDPTNICEDTIVHDYLSYLNDVVQLNTEYQI